MQDVRQRTVSSHTSPLQDSSGSKRAAFSLLELLVVIAIVAIIGVLTTAHYGDYRRQQTRLLTQAELLRVAANAEAHFALHNSYASMTLDDDTIDAEIRARYRVTLDQQATDLVIRAIPRGKQVGDGALWLSNTGEQRWYQQDSIQGSYRDW